MKPNKGGFALQRIGKGADNPNDIENRQVLK